MPQRVNFLEKGAFVLTYKKMLMVVVVWIIFCFSIFLLEGGYSWWLGKRVGRQQVILNQLNARKERTMALVEASGAGKMSPYVKELSEIYSNFPLWSKVMNSLSKSMPSQVWLTSISSEYLSGESMTRKIEIGGMAKNTSSIARFLEQLNDDPLFGNAILNKSDRVKDDDRNSGYSFVVLGEVRFGKRKWD